LFVARSVVDFAPPRCPKPSPAAALRWRIIPNDMRIPSSASLCPIGPARNGLCSPRSWGADFLMYKYRDSAISVIHKTDTPQPKAFIWLHFHAPPLHVVVVYAARRPSQAILEALRGLYMQDCRYELPRIYIPRTSVNSPQPTPRSGGFAHHPEVFSEKFSFLLSLLWAGRCTRKDFCGGTRREVDAARSRGCVCGGALVATIHKPRRSSTGHADATTTVTGGRTDT
jgi:hypothetical protein